MSRLLGDRTRRSVESDQVRSCQRERSSLLHPPGEEFKACDGDTYVEAAVEIRRMHLRTTAWVFGPP